MDSSWPSEDSEPLGVDFLGVEALFPALVFLSPRVEEAEDVEEPLLEVECGG